jgi:type III restriction enzyme
MGDRSQELFQDKKIINCIEIIKNETKLTKKTIAEILYKADNFKSLFNNSERFIYEFIKITKEELIKNYIDKIVYEVVADKFEIKQFENILSYEDTTQPVNNSIYDAIVYDSDVEQKFAIDLDRDERVKLFIKLPN